MAAHFGKKVIQIAEENRELAVCSDFIAKMSGAPPPVDLTIKYMRMIARENNIPWDVSTSVVTQRPESKFQTDFNRLGAPKDAPIILTGTAGYAVNFNPSQQHVQPKQQPVQQTQIVQPPVQQKPVQTIGSKSIALQIQQEPVQPVKKPAVQNPVQTEETDGKKEIYSCY